MLRYLQTRQWQHVVVVAPEGFGKSSLCNALITEAATEPRTFPYLVAAISIDADSTARSHTIDVSTTNECMSTLVADAAKSIGLINNADLSELIDAYGSASLLIVVDNADILLWRTEDEVNAWLSRLPNGWQVVLAAAVYADALPRLELGALSPSAGLGLARSSLTAQIGAHAEEDASTIALECDHVPGLIINAASMFGGHISAAECARLVRHEYLLSYLNPFLNDLTQLEMQAVECAYVNGRPLPLQTASKLLNLSTERTSEIVTSIERTPIADTPRRVSVAPGDRQLSLAENAYWVLAHSPLSLDARASASMELKRIATRVRTRYKPATGDAFAYDTLSSEDMPGVRDASLAAINACYGLSSSNRDGHGLPLKT